MNVPNSSVWVAVIGSLLGAPAVAAEPTPDEARQIAVEAYVYLYPLVTMDLTRRQMTNAPPGRNPMFGPPNVFNHLRSYPTPDMKAVVRPNFDTLYSIDWLDLTEGPVVVSVPDTHGRYYLMPMIDMWTDVFAVPGKRTSGTGPGDFAVVPPGWTGELPDNVQRIDATTPYVWIIGRTQTNGPDDYDAVHAIQDGFGSVPLRYWGEPAPAAPLHLDPTIDMTTPPKLQVDRMDGEQFFTYAAELMKVNPPHATDWSQLARLERIGLQPGDSLDLAHVSPAIRDALRDAPEAGQRAMAEQAPTMARVVDGWSMNTNTMGVYGDFYLKRAIVAQMGLGANQPEDAIYPMALTDSRGQPLRGGNAYQIHFDANQLPPVGAFWSVTLYDADGFVIPNALDRYALGDRDPLVFGPDGSLDLYVQNEDPGGDRTANWLPAPPSGAMGLTMRLYAPAPEALNGQWNPPPIERSETASLGRQR